MRGNPALADVNAPIWKELPEMVIRPSVAEPKFENLSVQSLDNARGKIETSALGLQPSYEAVEPAHNRSGGDTCAFAQPFDLGKRRAELIIRRIEPSPQLLHN
jgi:hypothetical protein